MDGRPVKNQKHALATLNQQREKAGLEPLLTNGKLKAMLKRKIVEGDDDEEILKHSATTRHYVMSRKDKGAH
jgi:hypothetical protein